MSSRNREGGMREGGRDLVFLKQCKYKHIKVSAASDVGLNIGTFFMPPTMPTFATAAAAASADDSVL
jgi:hypothetical protein